MNILEIFTEDVSDQVKFRKYCEFYRDLDLGNIIFNWDKTNAVLEDSVQEFYPEFIVLRDFFQIPKVLQRCPGISFNLERLKKIHLFFLSLDVYNTPEKKYRIFRNDFKVSFRKQLIDSGIVSPFKSGEESITSSIPLGKIKNLYHKCLPCGFYYNTGGGYFDSSSEAHLEFPLPRNEIAVIRDIVLLTEGKYNIRFAGSDARRLIISYNEKD